VSDERVITCDLDIEGWTVAEAAAYRKATKVNPQYAWGLITAAVRASMNEARELYGAAVDETGWTPPADWAPLAMLDLDPVHLAGFVYVAALRADPAADFDELCGSLHVGELSRLFFEQLTGMAEEAAPLANRQQRRAAKRGPKTKPATPSGTSTAARSARSTP
jgi:hypothetical protein